MRKYICEKCGLVEDTRIVEQVETLPVKGEDITFDSRVRVCTACGEGVFDEELDNSNLLKAYAIYRQRHDLITPDEIRLTRENYGLTQRNLSALLGLGDITIHRYESGSLPDEAQNQLLRLIQDPWNMQRLFEKNRHRLNDAAQRRIAARLDQIIHEETPERVDELIAAQHREPTLLTGYKPFSPDILMEMIVFFSSNKGVFKTKLNKLLWYADFLHFREYSVSISGAQYCHLPHGPVADQYDHFIGRLLADGSLVSREEDFGDFAAERLVATRKPAGEMFAAEAMKTLKAVGDYFSAHTSTQIRELSHQEIGYRETSEGEAIPYSYAESLQVSIRSGA